MKLEADLQEMWADHNPESTWTSSSETFGQNVPPRRKEPRPLSPRVQTDPSAPKLRHYAAKKEELTPSSSCREKAKLRSVL
ncbi:hypothetical protein EYF80_008878 [Liparis tanakae]|uniref:Uncharacterized protein n=1 Tax=Liparis tanakae TaxID=230148 RepID=A0A4Z2IUI0_9TELE|nr:hypothetical protein EYF80_008878 [Liparis tanakae]